MPSFVFGILIQEYSIRKNFEGIVNKQRVMVNEQRNQAHFAEIGMSKNDDRCLRV